MPKVYDDALKKLFRDNAQDFVSLIKPGLRVECLLPTELDAEHIFADGLVMCRDDGDKSELVHYEYQREKYDHIGDRMLEYNMLASRLNDYIPVLSCLLCLKKDPNIPHPPFIKRLRNGVEYNRFNYALIDLSEMTFEEFLAKAGDKTGLLPLIPLTEGGNQPAAVDIMINGLIEAKKTDLLWTGYALAAKVFDKNDLPWLKRRFAKMSDFLSDSPVYQELVTEATAKGKAEGIETGKMQAVSAMQQNLGKKLLSEIDQRFPDLNTLARKRVKGINDADVLLDLLLKVAGASTKQEAQEALTGSMKE